MLPLVLAKLYLKRHGLLSALVRVSSACHDGLSLGTGIDETCDDFPTHWSIISIVRQAAKGALLGLHGLRAPQNSPGLWSAQVIRKPLVWDPNYRSGSFPHTLDVIHRAEPKGCRQMQDRTSVHG
ncbi:hypothetical protein V8C26DRAFT_384333 [Trichoderma gracile]